MLILKKKNFFIHKIIFFSPHKNKIQCVCVCICIVHCTLYILYKLQLYFYVQNKNWYKNFLLIFFFLLFFIFSKNKKEREKTRGFVGG